VEPLIGWARSSIKKTRSASPSKARPTSAPVRGVERVGRVVGEGSVELGVHDLDLEGQAGEDPRRDEPAHAVRRVAEDLEGAQRRHVDEGVHVGHPLVHQVEPASRGERARRRSGVERVGQRLDLDEPGLHADGLSAGETELDPVVLRGVVRGGEHRAGGVEVAGGEVEEVRRGETEVDDLDTDGPGPLGEGLGERRARGAHVASHDDAGRAGVGGEGRSDGTRQALVNLVGIRSTDVVSLENLGRIHDPPHYWRRTRRLLSANQSVARPAKVATSLMTLPANSAGVLP
jgi:hypothetical protein